jgi:hypothetical protein
MSLLVIVLTLLGKIGLTTDAIAVAATFIPPIHMYRQLRGAYAIGRTSALLRLSALLFFEMWAVIAYIALLLAMGVLG